MTNLTEKNFTDTGVEIETLIEMLNTQDVSVRSAWLAGSIIEGLGNCGSDIDIYVAVNNLDDLNNYVSSCEQFKICVFYHNNRRLDYEYWSLDSINRLVNRLNTISLYDESTNILDTFSENEIDFLHRIFHSLPIYGNETLHEIQAGINRTSFINYMLENKRIYVDDAYDDALGMCESGNYKSAALRAQYTLGGAVDMYLYSNGLTNTKDKHRIRLFEKLAKSDSTHTHHFVNYWDMISTIPSSNKQLKRYTRNALELSEKFVDIAQNREIKL